MDFPDAQISMSQGSKSILQHVQTLYLMTLCSYEILYQRFNKVIIPKLYEHAIFNVNMPLLYMMNLLYDTTTQNNVLLVKHIFFITTLFHSSIWSLMLVRGIFNNPLFLGEGGLYVIDLTLRVTFYKKLNTGIPPLARPLLPRTSNQHNLNIETETSNEHVLLPRISTI